MPELPEVETVCRGLRPAMVGLRVDRVDQRRPDLRFPFPEGFVERLQGAQVLAVERRAKYILVRLDSGWTLLAHLGMSGRFTVIPGGRGIGHNAEPVPLEKHDHVIFDMADGGRLIFNDPRRFGFMDLMPTAAEAESPFLAHLGPEPLSDGFNPRQFAAALKGKKTPIKAALLDQRLVAGLGNIYVCEALWRAGISPRRSAHTVVGQRLERLVPAVKEILTAAIEAGGSSLRDYVQTNGELGYFQHAWDAYGREHEACNRPGCSGAITRIVQSGRSTFYCPAHQR